MPSQEEPGGKQQDDLANGNPADGVIKDSLDGSYWRVLGEDGGEDEVDDEEGRKYSFRNRAAVRREFINVTQLGGVGGGYATSENNHPKRPGLRSSDDYIRDSRDRPNYRDYLSRTRMNHRGKRLSQHDYKHKCSPLPRGKHRSGNNHRRHYDSSSESSSDSYSSFSSGARDDRHFRKHEARRAQQELDSILPINRVSGLAGSTRDKVSRRDLNRADVHPIVVDSNISFDSVGGLDSHILSLKEMVVLPLLYPDVFERFDTQPPRGVLFVGPPGTGKTLTARALANSLTTSAKEGGRSVSFFMRKGADCLSKWVGEGERQLRLLFEQAKKFQPSIIFFDEIDGLAPVRSIKQDQIHASIVSTLLALMDGLDARGQVVVIGATNRPDAIDSALRRPGRFDRELYFPLPNAHSRRKILEISTVTWNPPLSNDLKSWIVQATVGYCGADIKALCSESTLIAIRRKFPQIYKSEVRLKLDSSQIIVSLGDFAAAIQKIVPSSRRTFSQSSKPLDEHVKPLLESQFLRIVDKIREIFPYCDELPYLPTSVSQSKRDTDIWISALSDSINSGNGDLSCCSSALLNTNSSTHCPRLLISGTVGMGQQELGNATLHYLETFQIFRLDFNSLLSDSNLENPENVAAHRIEEAIKASPSVIYLPNILSWWKVASPSLKSVIVDASENFPSSIPVLWICTISYEEKSNVRVDDDSLDILEDTQLLKLLAWFSNAASFRADPGDNVCTFLSGQCSKGSSHIELKSPSPQERLALLRSFFDVLPLLPAKLYSAHRDIFENQMRSLTPDDELVVDENSSVSLLFSNKTADTILVEKDDYHLRELRVFFRASLHELTKDRKYAIFWRPVDPEANPDYYDIVPAPMDLDTMRMKVDDDFYETKAAFLHDVEQIAFNARLYNLPSTRDSRGRNIVHAANSLMDIIETHAYNFKKELGYDVFKRCDEIAVRRKYLEPRYKDRKIMHPENAKYYSDILKVHHIQKVSTSGGSIENESSSHSLRGYNCESWECSSCSAVNPHSERRCTTCGGRKPPIEFADPEPLRKKKIISKPCASSIVNDVEPDDVNAANADLTVTSAIDGNPLSPESRTFDDTELGMCLKSSISLANNVNFFHNSFRYLFNKTILPLSRTKQPMRFIEFGHT